ncbi:MAG: DegT/DnrJ/EryC1/StrS family aminotransferase [Candidatus Aminicenantes bacterium]|nr:DegT/DnrJ/EryC1/StrS family aminotransferase [Candidatus Aminicenantes bacterium]
MTKNKIRLSKSVVGKQEAEALSRVIFEDGYLGMGKEVQLFEQELQQFLRTNRQVVCVNSGTATLHLAVMATTKPREEILVQSLTFLSTFQAISAAGAIPVPCEVDPVTITINLEDAETRVTDRTRAILPVHYASNPGNLEEIYRFAQKYNLRVIEDAAHAFGCYYNEKLIGSFGDVVCFSFDGIKNITSGEGGAVVTKDQSVIQYVRDARLLGIHKDSEKRYQGQRSWEFDVTHQGYRYHMSNLFAAIGRVQLQRFEKEFKPKRIEIAKKYRNALKDLPGVKFLESDLESIVPHIFPIRVLHEKRDSLHQWLLTKNIEVGIHYKPNHLLSYYGGKKGLLPVTERLYQEILSLPLHSDLKDKDVEYIIESVKQFFESKHR